MPKMHQNTLGGRAPPGPAGGAYEHVTWLVDTYEM